MRGEDYYSDTIRWAERENALKVLEIARAQEREKEKLVKQGKMKKVVTYDPKERLTTIRYIKIDE